MSPSPSAPNEVRMLSIWPRTEILHPLRDVLERGDGLVDVTGHGAEVPLPAAAWTLITRWMVEWFTEARVLPGVSWAKVPR